MSITQRLWDESDLCRNDGADDIAALLDEAAREINLLRSAVKAQVNNIERWMQTGVPAGPEESRAIYEAARAALGEP